MTASAPESEAPPQRLGDRLEQALEHRADVEGEIERGAAKLPPRRVVVRTIVQLAICGVSLYLVAPSVLELLGSWRDLDELAPAWLLAMTRAAGRGAVLPLGAAARRAAHAATGTRSRRRSWPATRSPRSSPGGGAVGAALQYRMLAQAGVAGPSAVAGLTAANLLTLAIVLALPVLAIPALVRGGVDRTLVEAAVVGLVLLGRDVRRRRDDARARPSARVDGPHGPAHPQPPAPRQRAAHGTAEAAAARARPDPRHGRPPLEGCARRRHRPLGRSTTARCYVALDAVGSTPRPALVLLAFCAAQLLAQIPVTPGGLGFVEAGLTATLALCGVPPGDAVLATFAYRLFTYWLPLPRGACRRRAAPPPLRRG